MSYVNISAGLPQRGGGRKTVLRCAVGLEQTVYVLASQEFISELRARLCVEPESVYRRYG